MATLTFFSRNSLEMSCCSRTFAFSLLLWSTVLWERSLCTATEHKINNNKALLEVEGSGRVTTSNCSCDQDEMLDRVPYFLQGIGQTGQFDFAFQGPKGQQGFDGPEGPTGPEGRMGPGGRKGEAGEPGWPGLPGASHVSVVSGLLGHQNVLTGKSIKGEQGPPGPAGKRGAKGECGEAAGFIIQNGQHTLVKGGTGDRGRRGRKGGAGEKGELGPSGTPGVPGLSIAGSKGNKGEPAEIPDLELIRGSEGPRGPPGLTGSAGVGGQCGPCRVKLIEEETRLAKSVKGEAGVEGEVGLPGLPANGEGSLLISDLPGSDPLHIPGALVYEFMQHLIYDVNNVDPGTVAFVDETDQLFVRGRSDWKQIDLGSFYSSGST